MRTRCDLGFGFVGTRGTETATAAVTLGAPTVSLVSITSGLAAEGMKAALGAEATGGGDDGCIVWKTSTPPMRRMVVIAPAAASHAWRR